MNSKRTRIIVCASVGALALVGLLLAATGAWAGPDERGPAAPLAPAVVISDTISYQGRLLDSNGDPVDGTRTMTFRLYAEPTGGTPLWSQSGSVPVDDGLLNVNLDVDPALFDGQALWLGVQVAGDAQEMTPRQPLLPAPYAFSLRPGAIISGTANDPILSVVNTGSSHALWGGGYSTYAAIYGENYGAGPGVRGDSASGVGVHGLGAVVGVEGYSTNGYGVAGLSGNDCGIYGQSANAPAGFFTSTNSIGVHGNTLSTNPYDAAVLGMNYGSGPGVEGQSENHFGVAGISLNDVGVHGQSTNSYGVAGYSDSDVGVYGESINGSAGFFTSTNGIGVHAHTLSADPDIAAVLGENFGSGPGGGFISTNNVGVIGVSTNGTAGYFASTHSVGVIARSINEVGIEAQSINVAAGVFSSTNAEGIRVEHAGSVGLRILDTVGGQYIRAGSDADPDFIVTNDGTVFADGAYNCGMGPGAEPGTCIIQNSPADFAEMLPSDEGLEPGDVLVIGLDSRLARSTRAYQSTVVGVYSTQPGYLGGGEHRGHEGYAPLAVLGIVPVKVSAENGPIAPGDLLVASATPGHAMRAAPNPPVGTVIGKALEGLDAGTGVILALVMLQ